MKIIAGPNAPFWIITAVALYAALTEASWRPVMLWLGFVVLSLAIGLFGVWLYSDTDWHSDTDWRPPKRGP